MHGKRRGKQLLQKLTMCKAQLLIHVIKNDAIPCLLTSLSLPLEGILFIKLQSNSKHRARYPEKHRLIPWCLYSVILSSCWFMGKKIIKSTNSCSVPNECYSLPVFNHWFHEELWCIFCVGWALLLIRLRTVECIHWLCKLEKHF